MVKNTKGGNKAKKFAKKSFNTQKRKMRLPQNNLELYAVVVKHLGNCRLKIECSDGNERVCLIRGKFRGRNKSSNMVVAGSYILVGLHEWSNDPKNSQCDLLYVYDKDHYKEITKVSGLKATTSTGHFGTDEMEWENVSDSGEDEELNEIKAETLKNSEIISTKNNINEDDI